MKKVLILAPYPLGEAPSQRFRFEHYLPHFHTQGYQYRFQSFWTKKAWDILYAKGKFPLKVLYLSLGFFRRFYTLLNCHRFEFVFIHREVAPLGPPVFEFIIAKIFRRKIIYDFDDAIWLPNTSEANKISSFLKFHYKVAYICQISWRVSVGNDYLKEYALKFNSNVILNPTVVDTEKRHNRIKTHDNNHPLTIGWTGTHSTARYLKTIEKALVKLQKEVAFTFSVISNQPPCLEEINCQFIPWRKESEIEQLLTFDIGIMPLEDEIWEEGKCGFKIIQYLSLGIPAVASPVGVNKNIIADNENGFLVESDDEWLEVLKKLLLNPELRQKLGKKGRDWVAENYSVLRNEALYFSSFE